MLGIRLPRVEEKLTTAPSTLIPSPSRTVALTTPLSAALMVLISVNEVEDVRLNPIEKSNDSP